MQIQLLRPARLFVSDAFSQAAVGVDVQAAYGAAAASLATSTPPPLVTATLVSGLGVPGALVEVSGVAAVVR